MNKLFTVLLIGLFLFAGCAGRRKQSDDTNDTVNDTIDDTTPTNTSNIEINTSSVTESETGVDVDEIESEINDSEELFDDW